MGDLKIGLQMGYWGAGPNPKMVEIAQEAELKPIAQVAEDGLGQ